MESFFQWVGKIIMSVYTNLFGFLVNPTTNFIQGHIDSFTTTARDTVQGFHKAMQDTFCNLPGTGDTCNQIDKDMHSFDDFVRDFLGNVVPTFKNAILNTVSLYLAIAIGVSIFGFVMYYTFSGKHNPT